MDRKIASARPSQPDAGGSRAECVFPWVLLRPPPSDAFLRGIDQMDARGKSSGRLLEELAQLKETEAKWRSLVENAPNFIAIVDRQGVIQFLNHTQPGFTLEESIGKRIYDFLHPDYRQRAKECVERVFRSGQTASYETLAAGPHGEMVWYETRLGPIHHGDQIVAVTLISTEITARKRAEELLRRANAELEQRVKERTAALLEANQRLNREIEARRKSEQKYRSLVEQTSDLIWEMDEKGCYTYMSPKAMDLLGYESGELLGKTPFEFMPPEAGRRAAQIFKETLAQGEAAEGLRLEKIHRSGQRVVHEASAVPILDAQGKCRGFRGISRDITQREKIEEALRQSEQQYRQIFESVADSLFVADLEGRIVEANPAACRTYGYTRDEITQLTAQQLVHPDCRGLLDDFHTRVGTTGQYQGESVDVRKDGSALPIEVRAAPFLFKGKPHVLAVVRDVTERKEAEEKLWANEEKLRIINESTLDAVIMMDSSGKAVYWNPAAERMFGYDAEEIVGRDLHSILAPPRHRQEATRGLSRFSDSGQGRVVGRILEFEAVGKDGLEFPIELSVSPIKTEDQWCAVAVVRDITERKEAEAALRHEHHTLNLLLESYDRERQLLAYEIHDGLAQHLAAAIMQFQAIEHLEPRPPQETLKICRALGRLLNRCLNETRRLIAGVRPPILDESGVVRAVQDLICETTNRTGVEIQFHSKVQFDRLEPVLENAIYRIAQESLSNACRHSQSEKVRVELVQEGQRVRVDVRDWGIGFDPQQVDQKRYGLAGIRERARLLGGTVNIDSSPGEGTRIVVGLPTAIGRTNP